MRRGTLASLFAAPAAALTLALQPLPAAAAHHHGTARWTGIWEAAASGTVAVQEAGAPKCPNATPGSMRTAAFRGSATTEVPAGQDAVSDPVPLRVPDRILPAIDAGGHLHFSDTGLQAMADAVDLNSLTGKDSR
jgi:hypothetical protein